MAQGKISKNGQSIVCTVNDVIVTVYSDKVDEDAPEIVVGQ